MRILPLSVIGLFISFLTSVSAQDFVSPMGGIPYQDWTIVNYVDLDPSSGIVDWMGGGYSYNGHNAIDYTLPNFAAMDRGVDVYAAREGTVTAVHDGEYDRWSRVNPNPGHLPNYVVIDHGGGIVTEYLHLKAFSILVTVGQNVAAGQKIAEVGSSGYSSDPHLHFAVYDAGNVVETYENPGYWWLFPHEYAGDVFGTLDYGIIDHVPTLEELVNRPVDQDVFSQADGAGQIARSWVSLFGFKDGDQLDYFFYRPNGTEYAHWNWTTGNIRYGWWTASIALPSLPDAGEWNILATRNGKFLYSDSFLVVSEYMSGDVNQDGMVSLLDVQPFVDLLIAGEFQAEADINGDGVVTLLDVDPFVALLVGG